MSAPGRYGQFGGQFLPETLMPAVAELEAAFDATRADEAFQQELDRLLREWVGRPTPLSEAGRLAELVGLRRVMLKREDL
ncbi:MAG: tryptophan synthase subunit beta, partial [Candidatus Limnocylindria bacterium]